MLSKAIIAFAVRMHKLANFAPCGPSIPPTLVLYRYRGRIGRKAFLLPLPPFCTPVWLAGSGCPGLGAHHYYVLQSNTHKNGKRKKMSSISKWAQLSLRSYGTNSAHHTGQQTDKEGFSALLYTCTVRTKTLELPHSCSSNRGKRLCLFLIKFCWEIHFPCTNEGFFFSPGPA